MEKDWTYILEDSDAKVLVVATEAIYEKVKGYIGKVNEYYELHDVIESNF